MQTKNKIKQNYEIEFDDYKELKILELIQKMVGSY
jgi:hypothetical protein